MMYKRREAREQAFWIVFENMFNNESVSSISRMAETYRDIKIIPFGKKIAKYAVENQNQIDEIIDKYSKRWSLDRISKVSLAILRVSIAEILFINDVPPQITINEAIEISKKYVEKDESGYIHGLLGAFVDEFVDKKEKQEFD